MTPPAPAPESPSTPPLLAASGLVMDFPGVRALDAVDFELRPGEVHALMGENGAGKSTLIKVLTGLHTPGAGAVRVGGLPVSLHSPRDAEAVGVSTVYQEVDLVATMSVGENICLGRQPRRFGMINHRAMHRRAAQALSRVGVSIDTHRLLSEYPIALQQLAAIARALDVRAKALILDEPTSSLDAGEVTALFRVLEKLRAEGMGILFVTHFIDHVYQISDRITVLRNGARVGTWATPDLPRPALIEAMTGRKIEELRAAQHAGHTRNPDAPIALDVSNLGKRRRLAPTSFVLRRGSSLGLAGLLGSGRTELARLIFGADTPDSGRVSLGASPVPRGSIRASIARGLALSPEDRKADGLLLDLSVRENIVLALQARRGVLRPIPAAAQLQLARHYIDALRIKTPGPETPVRSLSGGNQQKVLLAKWMALQPSVLILDEPTRGVDVGAKAEIESLIASLRDGGVGIVFISAEIDEVVRVCDEVLVMHDRRPAGSLSGDALTEAGVLGMIARPHAQGAAP